jgi:3-phenylpropionate/trans-cinnamate dioxygenase ferredoxin subunit
MAGGVVAWHEVAAADSIGDDEAIGVKVGKEEIMVCRSSGELHALHNVCTHQYALLSDGYIEDGCIECPLHQGRFNLKTGEAMCAPVTDAVKVFPIKTEGGKVFVEIAD